MTNKLVTVLNELIREGYGFLTIKQDKDYTKYHLVNQRTSCAVMVTQDEIDISLCLQDDVTNKSYASERHITVESWDDTPAAKELIRMFEYWCDEASLYSEE